MGLHKELNRSVLQLLIGVVISVAVAGLIVALPDMLDKVGYGILAVGGYAALWYVLALHLRDWRALIEAKRNGILSIQLLSNIRIMIVRLAVWTSILLSLLVEHLQHHTDAIDQERIFFHAFVLAMLLVSTMLDRIDRNRIIDKVHGG